MSDRILEAEKIWKDKAWNYLKGLFKDRWLPSHDPYHHLRVWKNAVYLCNILDHKLPRDDTYFFEKLFLACLFHDTGLLINRGEDHGSESKKICYEFLLQNKKILRFEPDDLFEAIENHDDKSYRTTSEIQNYILFLILVLADDMDAFGAIGTYRYIEIYLLRNMNTKEIPLKILSNASVRYNHFIGNLKESGISHHIIQERYHFLVSVLSFNIFKEDPETLVIWIRDNIIFPELDPDKIVPSFNLKQNDNKRIIAFIDMYQKEMIQSK